MRKYLTLSCLVLFLLTITVVDNKAHSQTITFDYTGAAQNWVVPPGVDSISVTVRGAFGGFGQGPWSYGGYGAQVTANIAVAPGDVLYLFVGGRGGNGYNTGGDINAPGGFNGGGDGGFDASADVTNGGGGGGASDIRRISADLYSRIVVAGGGGGPGSSYSEGGNGGTPN